MGTDTLSVAVAAVGAVDTNVKRPPPKSPKQKGKKNVQFDPPASSQPTRGQPTKSPLAKSAKTVKLEVVNTSNKSKKQQQQQQQQKQKEQQQQQHQQQQLQQQQKAQNKPSKSAFNSGQRRMGQFAGRSRYPPGGRGGSMNVNHSKYHGRSQSHFPPGIYTEVSLGQASGMIERIKPSHIAPIWRSWESLAITISNLPLETSTFTLWKSFNACGPVDFIELFEDKYGKREGRARLRFKPPPKECFWQENRHTLELEDGQRVLITVRVDPVKRKREVPSPLDPDTLYPLALDAVARSLDIGCLSSETSLLIMRTVTAGFQEYVRFVANLQRREISIFFQMTKVESRSAINVAPMIQNYRIRIPFVHLSRVYRLTDDEEVLFIISLDFPPSYHRKLKDVTSTFSKTDNTWRSDETWYRQTDIVHNPQDLAQVKTSLRKAQPLINIGRWTTIRLAFHLPDEDNVKNLETLCKVLKDFNVEVKDISEFPAVRQSPTEPLAWKWIDPPSTHGSKRTSSLEDFAENEYINLSYAVRYQLEVCISHGLLSEYAIKKEFAKRLEALEERKAKDLLEHIANKKVVYHDPLKIFDIELFSGVTNRSIPKSCVYMRSATVTPSTIYFNTPTVDTSNRVIRHYIEYADRFLRVRFTDEKYEGRINSTYNNCMDEVFTRVKRTMTNGIVVGDRHYEFLAFGNSQFREHGAYFFASLPNLTAANIRAWMGHFSDIKVVAKHAARLGQCFSTTKAVTGCPVTVKEIDEIERNGFTFSDGVGRISKFLAQMIMTEFKIRTPSEEPPSVFQFRLGGCKGILTVSPEAQRREVHIRKSQYKFAAVHNGLEVIRHSCYANSNLNRQLIIVLSALGVTDGTFIKKLRIMLENLEEAMTSETRAMALLQKNVDPNQMTILLAHMVHDGFQASREPFLTSLLELWRAWQIKYLKEKAKIAIEDGACLFGCLDETATLRGYHEKERPAIDATYEERLDLLPEIFVQVFCADSESKYRIIEGPCIVARNPSLHPGDIRVVRAVNKPALHHLKDVIVFPQTGDRDIPSTCSGGDLDGDDYIVIWDPDLIPVPKDWFREPMDYAASNAQSLTRDVTVNDITSFFVTYMKNDRLPQIAHAHLAHADYSEDGVDDDKCIQLAQLHSAAVDYNKSGIPANMSKNLVPRKWPHFMEKKYKPKEAQYQSQKILGQLYDIVERVDFRPKLEAPFDERILGCEIAVSDDILQIAKQMKVQYDADMRRIMAQHEIKTEFEVWSTFALAHANASKDYKFHEELGMISTSLRDRFLKMCYDKAGGKDFQHLAPLAIAMYRVTAEEMSRALNKSGPEGTCENKQNARNGEKRSDDDQLPLISFPWILQHVLGKIANRHFDDTGIADGAGKLATWSSSAFEQSRIRRSNQNKDSSRDVETAGGIQHAGEVLELFQDNSGSEPVDTHKKLSDQPKQALNGKGEGIYVQTAGMKSNRAPEQQDNEHSNSLIELDEEVLTPNTSSAESTSRRGSIPFEQQPNLLDTMDEYISMASLNQGTMKSAIATSPLPEENKAKVESMPLFSKGSAEAEDLEDEEIEEIIVEEDGDIGPSAMSQLEALLDA